MRGTKVQGAARAGSIEPRSMHNGHHTGAVARKRSSARPAEARTPKPPIYSKKLAPFATPEMLAPDAQMWPVQPVLWLEPELGARLPRSSGLHIERRHQVPVAEFISLNVAPSRLPHTPENNCGLRAPSVRQKLPESGLAPLGWDPRAGVEGLVRRDEQALKAGGK